MNDSLHHIRLLAGLEIEPGMKIQRVLEREKASSLAGHLASDLARLLPEAEKTLLVAGAGLFEPNEALQPGFPAWQALEELVENMLRQSGFRPQVVALGAHDGRMPHANLQPPKHSPQGRFVILPLLLVCPTDIAQDIEARLEAELFESGSIAPPALAELHSASGVESVHGQLLTLNDLIALQHIQYDSAGLGGFWPLVEHVLLAGDKEQAFELPADMNAWWRSDSRKVDVCFISFDQAGRTVDDYIVWTRALRTLSALLDAHGIKWQPVAEGQVTFDVQQQMMIEAAGPSDKPSGLTVHHHSELGPVAWTVVEDGRMLHLYPLRREAADRIERELAARLPARGMHSKSIHVDPETRKLAPAQTE